MHPDIQTNDLLGDLLTDTAYEEATKWQRFFNYLIDYCIISLIPYLVKYSFALHWSMWEELTFSCLVYIGYYLLFEGMAAGRTPGKLATRTRAVMLSGEPVTFRKVLGRTFARMVPFEMFSALGERPWHDGWTDTRVIKEKNNN
jgi:uncharacterized RDD family membrane protein YckC